LLAFTATLGADGETTGKTEQIVQQKWLACRFLPVRCDLAGTGGRSVVPEATC
jgi:hypothetical protein